jgi:predicted RNA-binding protein (virulence factor B family)
MIYKCGKSDFSYLWQKIDTMNIELGKYNQLEIVKTVDFGVYLNGGDDGEILLPTRYVPEGCKPGDMVNVFIYLDNEERLIATTLQPKVQVGEFACLEVAWVNEYGAFLDWGLMKDLFVPFREQKMKMLKGHRYVVHAHVDEDSYRIMASAKVERYLSKEMPPYKAGEEVEVMAWQRTDLGYKVIVDNQYSGLVYQKEIFQALEPGMRLTAYVRQVREDGKIDLTLQKDGMAKVDDFSAVLLQYIKDHDGHTPLNDKSAAEDIYDAFGVSKKTFKKAVGDLYKRRLILLVEDAIRLV